MQLLSDLLSIKTGVTSIIGSGGKTTMLSTLARELASKGERVILTTSTHMFPFDSYPTLTDSSPAWKEESSKFPELKPTQLDSLLEKHKVITVGCLDRKTGKLSTPTCGFSQLSNYADYVLVEADGSKRLPLKLHRKSEPVIPKESHQTILLVGASGFGKPFGKVCHHPELLSTLSIFDSESDIDECSYVNDICNIDKHMYKASSSYANLISTPELTARCILAEGLTHTVFLNQIDLFSEDNKEDILKRFSDALGYPFYAGSLKRGFWTRC